MVFLFQPISCVFYPMEILPRWLQMIALANPAAHIFEGMRAVLATGAPPVGNLAWAVCLNGALLVGVIAWFYRTVAYCKDQGLLVRVGE
jgi:ABC-2 type transport system permease protein